MSRNASAMLNSVHLRGGQWQKWQKFVFFELVLYVSIFSYKYRKDCFLPLLSLPLIFKGKILNVLPLSVPWLPLKNSGLSVLLCMSGGIMNSSLEASYHDE